MRCLAANMIAGIHALLELWLFWLVLTGPLYFALLAVILVVVPMWLLNGGCWLTSLERRVRGHKVASMTRRLLHWGSFGHVKRTWYWQWVILLAALSWFGGRYAAHLWLEGVGMVDKLVLLAVVVQVITERVKTDVSDRYTGYVAAILGVGLALATKTGLLAAFDVQVDYAWVDYLLAGLVLSGGAGVLDALKAKLRK